MRTALCCLVVLFLTGCQKPSEDSINGLLKTGGQAASFYGLKEWDSPRATEVSTKLSTTIDNVLIPYLDAGNLPTADLVNEFVTSSLFNGTDERIVIAISTGAAALDALLPVPESRQYLNEAQIKHLKAFLTGVSSGCKKYLAGVQTVDKAPKYKTKALRKWVYLNKK